MATKALRLYLGNLPYAAQKADVRDLLVRHGIDFDKIDISIDPFTGRNPSYCFIDFHTAEYAQRALQDLSGQTVRGRPVKLNFDTRRSGTQAKRERQYVFDTWARSDEAPSRWLAPHEEGRRLYVGGLPRIPHKRAVNSLMRGIFRKYSLEAVSKLISPHSSTRTKPGEHHYCFVDLPTPGLAEDAARSLNGILGPHGAAYRISVTSNSYPKKVVREQFGGVYPGEGANKIVPPARNLDGNWRRNTSLDGGELSI